MISTSDLFSDIPDHARLWTYVASRDLSSELQTEIVDYMRSFLSSWTSHDLQVHGDAAILGGRFLCIAAFVIGDHVSGCGIDKSTRALGEIARANDFEWLDGLHVFHRDETDEIVASSRSEFRSLVMDGTVDSMTRVFDLSADTLGEMRARDFEKSASESWHARVFKIQAPLPA